MRKKLGLFWFAAALLGAALIFAGCENPAGSDGAAGAAGAIYLSGNVTTDGINDALASGAPVVFAGVTQSDTGVVVIEAGKAVKLVGPAAYTPDSGGTLLLRAASSVTGNGLIDASAGTVIGPADVATKVSGALVEFQEGTITFTGGIAAVLGDVTVGAGTGELPVATLAGNTLYVIGDLTVSAEITGTPAFYVLGDATVSVAATGAVDWDVSGTLTASKAPTAGGSINAAKLDIKGAGTAVTFGKVDVGELETAATVVITTGTGGLTAGTVTGAATFATGAVITSAAFGGAATFNGTATLGAVRFGGDVTLAVGSVVTLSTGAVTLAINKTIKVGSDTVLTAGAAAVVLTPAATGATLTAASKKLTLGAQNLTITSGTLTVAAGAELALGTALTVGPSASLVLTGAASTGAKISGTTGVKAGATTITGIWQAVGTAGTVTIAATSATASSITASATTVAFTASADGTITQAAGAGNNLTIAADTTIALGGTTTKLGEIVLVKDATNPGKLSFAATGAQITTGVTTGSPLTAAGGVFVAVASATTDTLGVSAFGTANYVTITGGDDSLKSIVWGAGTAYIIGPKASSGNDGKISSTTDCET